MEQLQNVCVIRLILKILFDQLVNGLFKKNTVIYGHHTNIIMPIPTWSSSSGDGIIHDIV